MHIERQPLDLLRWKLYSCLAGFRGGPFVIYIFAVHLRTHWHTQDSLSSTRISALTTTHSLTHKHSKLLACLKVHPGLPTISLAFTRKYIGNFTSCLRWIRDCSIWQKNFLSGDSQNTWPRFYRYNSIDMTCHYYLQFLPRLGLPRLCRKTGIKYARNNVFFCPTTTTELEGITRVGAPVTNPILT